MIFPTTLLKVDKLSQQPLRGTPPNHWSWYQNVRLPGPPGPPPPTRPIHGGSSPSQGTPNMIQPGRRYGSSHPNPRSPTSSMLNNISFPPAPVSQSSQTEHECAEMSSRSWESQEFDIFPLSETGGQIGGFKFNCFNSVFFQLVFSTCSLWETWSIPPASFLNLQMGCRAHRATHSLSQVEQLHRRHCTRFVGEQDFPSDAAWFQRVRVLADIWFWFVSFRDAYQSHLSSRGLNLAALSPPSPSLCPNPASLPV